jgi:hypothetical protein
MSPSIGFTSKIENCLLDETRISLASSQLDSRRASRARNILKSTV